MSDIKTKDMKPKTVKTIDKAIISYLIIFI